MNLILNIFNFDKFNHKIYIFKILKFKNFLLKKYFNGLLKKTKNNRFYYLINFYFLKIKL